MALAITSGKSYKVAGNNKQATAFRTAWQSNYKRGDI
jgi:hypothetical protein